MSGNLDLFRKLVPATMRPRFAAKLTDTDWLIVYKDAGTDVGPHDNGFVIVRSGHVLIQQTLMSVPQWKKFAKEMDEGDLPAFGIAAAQVCLETGNTVIIGFQVCCTTSSGELFFIVTKEGNTYRATALPMVAGGKLEISQSRPVRIRLWNEMGDGLCDGCPQHYKISEYQILNGTVTFVRTFTSKLRFKPGAFDPHRIALLPLSN